MDELRRGLWFPVGTRPFWVAFACILFLVGCEEPAAPTGLVSSWEDGALVLRWNQNNELNLTGYRVYRDGVLVAEQGRVPTHVDDTLVDDTVHEYWVVAVTESDGVARESDPSSSVFGARGLEVPQENPPVQKLVAVGDKLVKGISGQPVYITGFNYIHDNDDALLEHFWVDEFERIEEGLDEIVSLGGNAIRLHPQLPHFMTGPGEFVEAHFQALKHTCDAAAARGIYVHITGLGMYVPAEEPAWMNEGLTEAERWDVQAQFWSETARRLAGHPAVYLYDLINEPTVPSTPRTDWTVGNFGGFSYVQNLVLDPAGRDLNQIARDWVATMRAAIRAHDSETLITLGMMPFPTGPIGVNNLDDLLEVQSPHLYPDQGEIDRKAKLVDVYSTGKPVVVGETGVLHAGPESFEVFLREIQPKVAGYVAHYFGKTIEDYGTPTTVGQAFQMATFEKMLEVRPYAQGAAPDAVPLHSYYNPTLKDHYYTLERDDVAIFPWGWEYSGVAAYVLPVNADGNANALCTWWSADEQNHSIEGDCLHNSTGEQLKSIGFGYSTPQPGTVPLHTYVHGDNGNTVYLTARNDSALAQGGYAYTGVVSHVFPVE